MKLSLNKSKILIIFVVILLVLSLNFYRKEVKTFFYLFSMPIQKTLWQKGERVSEFFETIFEIENLKEENKEFKLKVQEMFVKNNSLKELEKENRFLREALEIGLEKEFKLVLSRVISKDISKDTLLIDKGSEHGISKGFPIITQQKVLVGKISEVYKNFSKIMLISNKESSFDAEISNKDIEGLIKGKGNFSILFDLIPKDKEIFQGDIVVTGALGGVFPKGLLVGEIQEIKKLDIEPFQQAEIKPAFNTKEIENLFIIINF